MKDCCQKAVEECMEDVALHYVKRSGLLNVFEIDEVLHNAGLHAYCDYKKMGKSGIHWSQFRLHLATAIYKVQEEKEKTEMKGEIK